MPAFVGTLITPRLAAAPTPVSSGQLYYDTAANALYYYNGTTWVAAGAGAGPADATTQSKGIVQLAGDLAGTAASPQIAAGVITDADVNAAAAIAESKLALATDAAAGTGSRRTLGAGATQAAAGNDPRFGGTGISYGASPPGSPVNGQMWVLPAGTNLSWQFRYNSSSSSASKWEFTGGGAVVGTSGSMTLSTAGVFTDITGGPVFTTPRAGDYLVEGGCQVQTTGYTSAYNIDLAISGGAGATCTFVATAAFAGTFLYLPALLTSLAAGATIKLQGRIASAQNTTFNTPTLVITPLRVT